jgi:hypothetical protein
MFSEFALATNGLSGRSALGGVDLDQFRNWCSRATVPVERRFSAALQRAFRNEPASAGGTAATRLHQYLNRSSQEPYLYRSMKISKALVTSSVSSTEQDLAVPAAQQPSALTGPRRDCP